MRGFPPAPSIVAMPLAVTTTMMLAAALGIAFTVTRPMAARLGMRMGDAFDPVPVVADLPRRRHHRATARMGRQVG